MADQLSNVMRIASSGLHAQSTRLRIVSENLANAKSTGATPGADPYQRKTISFTQALDEASGATLTRVSAIGRDNRPFVMDHQPGHVAANAEGMVKMPNVEPLREMADMREANRSYEANLQVVKQVREMRASLLDILKGR
jgi:flagellar basal-body rod protein FlgC